MSLSGGESRVFTAAELLTIDESELIQFLKNNRSVAGGYDISSATGLESLSKDQRDKLSERLRTAAPKAELPGSLNIDALLMRLNHLDEDKSPREQPKVIESTSLTCSTPSEAGNDEAVCYQELVNDGGRPALSIDDLPRVLNGPGAYEEAVRPWLSDSETESRDNGTSTIFSRQLNWWWDYRKWQIDNRTSGGDGFAAFFEARKRKYVQAGEDRMVNDPTFEPMLRRQWERKSQFEEPPRHDGLFAYTRTVKSRLTSHNFNFTRPLRLKEDPRRQDDWTTWVECLSFVYWLSDRYTSRVKRSEPRYRNAWGELLSFNSSQSSTVEDIHSSHITSATAPEKRPAGPGSTATKALERHLSTKIEMLQHQLTIARAGEEAAKRAISTFIQDTHTYHHTEECASRYSARAQWVLEQVLLIENDAPRNGEASVASEAHVSKKRRREVHDERPAERKAKRGRQGAVEQTLAGRRLRRTKQEPPRVA